MAIAAADKKGFKRICLSCSTRFYDFNKRPIVCPNCEAEFSGEVKVKAKRGRAVANDEAEVEAAAPVVEEAAEAATEEAEAGDDDVISLEEVEEDADVDDDDTLIEDDLEDLDDALEDEEEEDVKDPE